MANKSIEIRNYFKLELLIDHSCVTFRNLFKSRYLQFYGGTAWTDSPTCGNHLLTSVTKKKKKKKSITFEEKLIKDGNSNQWDLVILINVLLLMERPTTLTTDEIQQLDREKKYLEQLKNVRNRLEHHPRKSVTDPEFNELWDEITAILVVFGHQIIEFEKYKDDSIFDSSKDPIDKENVKEALRLNSRGTQAHKAKNYVEAIQFFAGAANLPNISRQDQAIAYSNMAASRLLLYEQQQQQSSFGRVELNDTTDERDRALKDAKQAKHLCPTWWKGHFRVGKVYVSFHEHEKAIDSFERAYVLDPTKTEIQNALDDSRHILSQQMRKDHLDPRMRPITIPEHLEEMKEMFNIDPIFVRTAHISTENIDPPGADVIKAHKYENGDDDVKQDYEQAAKYFARAASQGNAEGMYNLARLTASGLGVKKDHKRALELLQQAADQSPENPLFRDKPNVGVAEAEHSLGLRYSDGITVQKNPALAAYWYQRAVDHGCAASANNLGLMYLDGTGVDQHLEKAEQLLKYSARGGDPNAMLTLAEHFLSRNDIEMAKIMYERACQADNVKAKIDREMFYKRLEVKHQLLGKRSPNELDMINAIGSIIDILRNNKTPMTYGRIIYAMYYPIFVEYANHGSITARRMCYAVEHFFQAIGILMKNEILTEEQENIFFHELSQCYRIEHIVAQFPSIDMNKRVDNLIDRVLCRCSEQSNSIPSELDENVRVCYATRNMNSYETNVKFLQLCKAKYPQSIYFFEISGSMNGFLHEYQDALYDFNSGLLIEPDNIEFLYNKAVILRQLNKDMDEAIAAYEKFLSIAPKDHRKVPEAYYAMGICRFQREPSLKSMDLIRKLYNKGKQAEQLQLPCFVPYKSGSATIIEYVINIEQSIRTKTVPVRNRKLRLTDPYRIQIIKKHRLWDNQRSQMMNFQFPTSILGTHKPRFKQQAPKSLVNMKSITIREMDPRLDKIYHGYVLTATIIEDTRLWTPSIHLLIEDENLDCERLHIYGFPEEEGQRLINEEYTIGRRMHIMNPYLRLGAEDHKAFIRVNDTASIVILDESERIQNMCRCCGESNAPHVCSKCLKARYCSKECQNMDWKLYKHNLIC